MSATTMVSVDGFPVAVSRAGPAQGPFVVLLGAAKQPLAAYDSLCKRLHTAAVRTVVIAADPRLHPKAVVAILDALEVPWAVLAGDRFGAEVAWGLAAMRPDRFTGLVVVNRGHPRIADLHGVIRDQDCPPVEINTTALVTTTAARAAVTASQRCVHSDFRLVEVVGRRSPGEVTAALAAEIVLRTCSW